MKLLEENENVILERKYRNILSKCGKGTILLGIWYVFKMCLYLFLVDSVREEIREEAGMIDISEQLYIFLAAVIFLVMLFIRIRVGLIAIQEGKGKTAGIWYLVLVAVLTVASLCFTVDTFNTQSAYFDRFDRIATFALEFVSTWINAEIFVYSVKLRKAVRRLAGEKGA